MAIVLAKAFELWCGFTYPVNSVTNVTNLTDACPSRSVCAPLGSFSEKTALLFYWRNWTDAAGDIFGQRNDSEKSYPR